MSVSSVQAYEAAMLANHIADDAYAAGVYAAALAAVAASGVPPIDREVSNGGGSGICDCVAASFTTDIQATVAGTFATLTDISTSTGIDPLGSYISWTSNFSPMQPDLSGGVRIVNFAGLNPGQYLLYINVTTVAGAKGASGAAFDWDGTTLTYLGSNPQTFNYFICVANPVAKYEDGVLLGYFDPITDAAYTPVGTLKTSCGLLPNLEIIPDWEQQVPAVRKLVTALPGHICLPDSLVPAGYLPFELQSGTGVASHFAPATDVTDLYIHAFFETIGGQGFDVITGALFTGSTPGVLATNTAAVQIAIDACLVAAGFTAGQAVYAIDTVMQQPVIWQDPSLPVGLLQLWGGDQAPAGTYTNKILMDFASAAVAPAGTGCLSCREIQIEKYLEADGVTITEEFYLIGARTLTTLAAGEVVGWGACPETVTPAVSFDLIEAGTEILPVTNGGVVTLTVPTGAVGAYIQVQDAPVRFFVDGNAPTTSTGFIAADTAYITLGNAPQSNHEGDAAELAQFQVIASTATNATLYVIYYKQV